MTEKTLTNAADWSAQVAARLSEARTALRGPTRVDRRLRRIAKEIREFVLGEDVSRVIRACSRCARIGEEEWGFCPWCGFAMMDAADD